MDQSFSNKIDLVEGGFEKISGAIRNCGRWPSIMVVKLPDIELGVIKFSIANWVFGFISYSGCLYKEESVSRNLFVDGCCLYLNKSILKSPRRKTV